MAADPYVSTYFKVTATFENGGTTSDIVAVSASFALNTIPTATLIMAVGFNPVTNKHADIHTLRNSLKPREKVTVELEIFDGAGNTSKLQPGKYTIFDGFVAGVGIQRSHNQFNYVINLTHWLSDLNNSSMIHGNWFPGVPQSYATSAMVDVLGRGGAGNLNGINIQGAQIIIDSKLFSLHNIETDIWSNSFLPLFNALADGNGSITGSPKKNDAAKNALARMPGSGPYSPLAFLQAVSGSAERNFSASIAKYVSDTIRDSSAQNTFWGKLISEYCPQFLFAISPAVEWAIPIPFCPGLRWRPGDKKIKISDYSFANCNANMSQIIESVCITAPLDTANGTRKTETPSVFPYYAPAVEYPPSPTEDNPGLKLFKTPPAWYGQMSATIDAGLLATADAVTTAAPNVGQGNSQLRSGGEAAAELQPLLKKFAEHWYFNEVLQSRYGEISGPLRFDIAPGSVVKIELPASSQETGSSNEFVVASIMSVSYVINAERAVAGTSFAIAHTKTTSENTDPDYSTDVPPLYPAANWRGGPLARPKP